jgi:hypothetical protein
MIMKTITFNQKANALDYVVSLESGYPDRRDHSGEYVSIEDFKRGLEDAFLAGIKRQSYIVIDMQETGPEPPNLKEWLEEYLFKPPPKQ